jgi:hypothetical protein
MPPDDVLNGDMVDGWGGGELDPAQQEWVRQFVMRALNDEEDSGDDM